VVMWVVVPNFGEMFSLHIGVIHCRIFDTERYFSLREMCAILRSRCKVCPILDRPMFVISQPLLTRCP